MKKMENLFDHFLSEIPENPEFPGVLKLLVNYFLKNSANFSFLFSERD